MDVVDVSGSMGWGSDGYLRDEYSNLPMRRPFHAKEDYLSSSSETFSSHIKLFKDHHPGKPMHEIIEEE